MEYQAKELFAKHGVPVTMGIVATTPEEARAAAEQLGVVVVKAQVKAGGRGKAGGVKLARTPDEAFEHAQAILMVLALWKVFVEEDATLVEVNPLARLEGDTLEALDGKVSLDENAAFRHPDHAEFEDRDAADPLEAKAKAKGLNYVKLDGE